MITTINGTLKSLCEGLSGAGSVNYAADMQLFHCLGVPDRSVADTVSAAFGWTVFIQSTTSIDRTEILAILKQNLEYAGGNSVYPNRDFLTSEQFKKDEEEVLRFFDGFLADADQLISFSLKEGHPFYPVFWDFAFLIEKGSDAFVLIGSSSD